VIRIRVELSDHGGNHSSLEVEAQNIEQALRQVSARYPGYEAKVVFPIDPEAFFVGDALAMIQVEATRRTEERGMGVVRAPTTATVTQEGRRHR
jgi:hypothetical protein